MSRPAPQHRTDADGRRLPLARVLMVSGIPAGEGGTGLLVAHLLGRLAEFGFDPLLPTRPNRLYAWQVRDLLLQRRFAELRYCLTRQAALLAGFWFGILRILVLRRRPLLLLHPQNLGYRLSLFLLRLRKVPATLYLLDSAYFCVRSYNHREGEQQACLACIEHGPQAAVRLGCPPFPRPDRMAFAFVTALAALVKAGRVRVVAQNRRQAEQAQQVFGAPALPPVAGLWSLDWDDLVASGARADAPAQASGQQPARWDVVFHGHLLHAKGAAWLVAVARHAPQLRFLFPGTCPSWMQAPANCHFQPSRWDTGLREQVQAARVVAVPSLWSAPIEGALLKSIVLARAVAVVHNPAAYCDELPDGLVLKLSADPALAAQQLIQACATGWQPDAQVRARWVSGLPGLRERFVPDLLGAVDPAAPPPRGFPMSRLAWLLQNWTYPLRPGIGQLGTHPPRPLPRQQEHADGLPEPTVWPRISIVVPSFNQGQFLARTLDSLLSQDYPDLELLVVDGGSSDDTQAVLARYADRLAWWVSEPDRGQADAINKGFRRATGELLAWINSDDLAAPGALRCVARFFLARPDVGAVYGDRILIDEHDRQIGRWTLPFHSARVLRWVDYVPQETLYWRRSTWDRVGARLDDSLHFALDWDLLLRMASQGVRMVHLPRALGMFRVHADQKTVTRIADIGREEIHALRCRELGRAPGRARIRLAIAPYLLAARGNELRLLALDWMGRLFRRKAG